MTPEPNFFIFGAPKCGTTALYQYLSAHPDVGFSSVKEPHYFCDDLSGFRSTTNDRDYANLFAHIPEDRAAVGEASVFYLYSTRAASQVRARFPSARVIVMLRSYSAFLLSYYRQAYFNRYETERSFERAWAAMERRRLGHDVPAACPEPRLLDYQAVASFGAQIERLLDVFPREQVHFILQEDFAKNTADEHQKAVAFLGLRPHRIDEFPRVNEALDHRWVPLATALARVPAPVLRASGAVKRAVGLDHFSPLGKLWRLNSRAAKGPTPDDLAFARRLAKSFAADAERVSAALGRDVRHWAG